MKYYFDVDDNDLMTIECDESHLAEKAEDLAESYDDATDWDFGDTRTVHIYEDANREILVKIYEIEKSAIPLYSATEVSA